MARASAGNSNDAGSCDAGAVETGASRLPKRVQTPTPMDFGRSDPLPMQSHIASMHWRNVVRRIGYWADIRGCFDNISHDWLLTNVPMDKVVLRKWLRAGYVDQGALFATEAGTRKESSLRYLRWTLDGGRCRPCKRGFDSAQA